MSTLPIRLALALPAQATAIVGGVIVLSAGQVSWPYSRVAMVVSLKSIIAARIMLFVQANPTRSGTAVVAAGCGHGSRVWRSGPCVIFIPAFQRLEGHVSGSPFRVGMARAIQVTAIVYVMRQFAMPIRWRPCLRLRGVPRPRLTPGLILRLRRRRAMSILKSPIAVRPFLVGVALPIDETAIVDWGLRRRAAIYAAVADPTRHPDLATASVDHQPSALLAQDLQD